MLLATKRKIKNKYKEQRELKLKIRKKKKDFLSSISEWLNEYGK